MIKEKISTGYTDQYGNKAYLTKTIDWFPIIVLLTVIIMIGVGLYFHFKQQNPNVCAILCLIAIFTGIIYFIGRFLHRYS